MMKVNIKKLSERKNKLTKILEEQPFLCDECKRKIRYRIAYITSILAITQKEKLSSFDYENLEGWVKDLRELEGDDIWNELFE